MSHKSLEVLEKAEGLTDAAAVLRSKAIVLLEYGKFQESQEILEKGLYLDPTNDWIQMSYAEGLLRLGQWKDGLERLELYRDWKPKITGSGLVEWNGTQDLSGKTIMVVSDGGMGDLVMFSRFFKCFKDLGAKTVFLNRGDRNTFFNHQPFIDEGYGEKDAVPFSQFNYWTSCFSLPYLFQAKVDSIPGASAPYLVSNAPKQSFKGPSIGICWEAGELFDPRKIRTLDRDRARAIVEAHPEFNWVSLQYGQEPLTPQMTQADLTTWDDTAAAINACDLVVSVDTGVCHLAGALNKPAWMILTGCSAWYWLSEGEDCAWYPSVKLLRNGQNFGYDVALAKLEQKLQNYKQQFEEII